LIAKPHMVTICGLETMNSCWRELVKENLPKRRSKMETFSSNRYIAYYVIW